MEGGNGNVELLKQVFLPTAIINGSPIEALYRSVERYGQTHATARIDYLDVSGHAGMAKVIVEDWHGQDYVEYLQLLKEDGRWTIISKAFDTYVDTYITE